jgi:hypothetical protein
MAYAQWYMAQLRDRQYEGLSSWRWGARRQTQGYDPALYSQGPLRPAYGYQGVPGFAQQVPTVQATGPYQWPTEGMKGYNEPVLVYRT